MPSETFSKRVPTPLVLTIADDGDPKETFITNSYLDVSGSVTKGGPVPHYRKVIASGGNATTSLIGTLKIAELVPSHMEYNARSKSLPFPNGSEIRTVDGAGAMDFGFNPGNLSLLSIVTADNRALTKFYEHVNAVETSFKGMVFTGELRESLNMIRSPARSLRRGVSDYLNTLRSVGARLPKKRRPSFVRDTWLEYSFGWKPLISDLDSAIKSFYLSRAAKPIFQMVSGWGEDKRQIGNIGVLDTSGPLRWSYRVLQTSNVYVRYYGIYRSRGNGVSDSHRYGFRPAEFVPTIWELIPYSFLVDYFTNVGNILQSWSYRFIAMNWTARTIVKEYENSSYDGKVFAVPSSTHIITTSGHPGSRRLINRSIVRDPAVSPGVPSLELKVPGMGSTKWLNILALSKQAAATSRILRS